MSKLAFTAKMEIYQANPFIFMSAARVRKVKADWKKPMPVLVRINGEPKAAPWRINMMPIGDSSFRLYLHGQIRKASQTAVGDRVRVQVEFDTAYRNGPMHPMPSWFQVPLAKNAKAKRAWDALTPSCKKEILRYFSWLKSPEARQRNLARALAALSGKGGRFMARSW